MQVGKTHLRRKILEALNAPDFDGEQEIDSFVSEDGLHEVHWVEEQEFVGWWCDKHDQSFLEDCT